MCAKPTLNYKFYVRCMIRKLPLFASNYLCQQNKLGIKTELLLKSVFVSTVTKKTFKLTVDKGEKVAGVSILRRTLIGNNEPLSGR